MKLFSVKNIRLLTFALVLCCPHYALSKDRDPFSPSNSNIVKSNSVSVSSDDEFIDSDASNPLTSSKISGYKIIGVILSEKENISTVKSLSGVDYIIKTGQRFGSEGGRVKEINYKGIKVEKDGNISFLPISNKIEVGVEE